MASDGGGDPAKVIAGCICGDCAGGMEPIEGENVGGAIIPIDGACGAAPIWSIEPMGGPIMEP